MKTCRDYSLQKAPYITIDLKEKLVSAAFARGLCSSKPHWSHLRQERMGEMCWVSSQCKPHRYMFHFISFSYLCFSSLIYAGGRTAEMSETKDKEECYLTGCHMEPHRGVQNSQNLNVDSETWSEKSLSFSKASKTNSCLSCHLIFYFPGKQKGILSLSLFCNREIRAQNSGETKGSYMCTVLLYAS